MTDISNKKFSIEFVLKATKSTKDYEFFAGVPVDMRNKKYNRWREMYKAGLFRCKMCGKEAAYMRLVKCNGNGSIHKKSGATKHNFQLFDKTNVPMTFDHWIPKSFLKRKQLFFKAKENLVMMCKPCNRFKADAVPHNWKDCYRRMELNYDPLTYNYNGI